MELVAFPWWFSYSLFIFNFCYFNYDVLDVVLFALILFGTLCAFWVWMFSFLGLRNFQLFCLQIYSLPLSLSSLSGIAINSNVCMHDAVSIISYTVFIYFPTYFFFFCLASVISTTLSTSLLIHCSVSTSAFFISVVFVISL